MIEGWRRLPLIVAAHFEGEMLVIQRKKGQGIKIGNEIFVKVLRIRGNHVTLGFEAGAEVKILREELPGRSAGRGDEHFGY